MSIIIIIIIINGRTCMSWPSGVAQSNRHLNTMTVYDDDDDGEEEEGLEELEDDYDHSDGVLSHHVDSYYISLYGRQEWPSPTRT